jgi:polar amino acid transport system substrate-binding protein
MKHLLTATAVLEVGAGLALLTVPTLLFGPEIGTPTGSTVARIAGAALLAIGVACWLARHDGQSYAARGLVGGLLVYNALVVAVLMYAGTALRVSSSGLWPAAAIHAAMTVWCMTSLLRRRSFSMRTPLSLWCLAGLLLLAGYATDVPAAGADAAAGLRILTAENPPLNFSQDGEIKGLAAEVVRELIRRTDTGGDIEMTTWPEGYRTLSGQPNVALFSTVMTAERRGLFQWVGPLATQDTNLYVLKGSGIEIANLDQARKAGRIATVAKYYSEQMLAAENFTNTVSNPDRATSLRQLLDGTVQLLASSNTEMPAALAQAGVSPDDVRSAFTLSTDLIYIAFSRGTPPALVARWQEELDAMKRDGTFARIYARWFPAEVPPGIFQLVTEEYPPVTFVKAGKPSGFVTDMVREIAARQGIPDNIRLTSWKNGYNLALLNPKVVLFSAERTPEREGLFHWVGPVGRNSAILYARKGSGIRINSLDEARKVAAIGTTTDWFTEQQLKREGFDNLLSSPDPRDNVRQLMNGDVQLAVFTDITVPEIVREAGYGMADLEPVFTVGRTYFYIALSRDTPAEVVASWQATLDQLKQDGTFERIYRNYLPDAELGDLLVRQ